MDLLAGIWNQSGKDIWLEIKFDHFEGNGRMIRNDRRPESAGKTLLAELTSSAGEGKGQGFMSKTVDWLRVKNKKQPQNEVMVIQDLGTPFF